MESPGRQRACRAGEEYHIALAAISFPQNDTRSNRRPYAITRNFSVVALGQARVAIDSHHAVYIGSLPALRNGALHQESRKCLREVWRDLGFMLM